MKDRNENRPGYKKTKVGWIPQSWTVVAFDKIFQRLRRPVNVAPQKKYQEIGIRSHGKGIFHKDQICGVDLGNKSVFWVQAPALVFNIVFAWEQAVAVTSKKELGMIASHRFPMFGARRSNVVLDYVYWFFISPRGKHLIGLASPGGAGRNKTLGQSELRQLLLPLPPFPEQKKITEIISTWDEALEQTRKLIEAKMRQKKALMQQLLSGRVRFPEFGKSITNEELQITNKKGGKRLPERWEIKRLGSFGSFLKGKGISNSEKTETGIPCITYGEIYTKHNFVITQFFSYINKKTAQKAQRIKNGDILFAGSGETLDEIGKCVAHTKNIEAYAGGDIVIFRPKGVNLLFLSYLLNSDLLNRQKRKLGQGHSVVHIYSAGLKTLEVPLPSFEEQTRIAAVLSSCEREFELLRRKETDLREQKKGLMQKLLTGEVRVKL